MGKKNTIKYMVIITVLFLIIIIVLIFNYLKDDLYGIEAEQDGTGKQELVIVHWIDLPEEILKEFESEYQDIKLKYYKYNPDIYQKSLEARIDNGLQVDVMGVPLEMFRPLYERELLTDLSDKAFLNSYRDDVRSAVRNGTDDGEYAVGLSSTYYGMWYNRTLFERYNLEIPKSYEEFLELCRLLRLNQERPLLIAGTDSRLQTPLKLIGKKETELQENGGGEIDEKLFTATEDYIPQKTYQQAFAEFKEGKYAMLALANDSVEMCGLDMENVFEPSVFAFPFSDDSGQISVPYIPADNMIAICSKSRRERESDIFLNFLSRKEVAEKLVEKNSWISTREHVDGTDIPYMKLWTKLAQQGRTDISRLQ